MGRYTVPEPDVENFEGWDKDDIFDFGDQGDNLTYLVRRTQEPLVIALDADWGTGKTIFLKRWWYLNNKKWEAVNNKKQKDVAGEGGEDALLEGNDGGGVPAFKTIYFDAFAHDYFDDPFAALMGEILDQLGRTSKKKFAKAARLILKAVARAGTNGLGGFWGRVVGAIFGCFLNIHKTRKEEVKDFQEALKTIAEKNGRIVIIIDELDRCKPDFALNLLEYIKHLFNVDNVHFILGMNSKALEEMVKTRYGAEIDASQYLDKFITVKMGHRPAELKSEYSSCKYFREKSHEMGLGNKPPIRDYGQRIGSALIQENKPPLRDINQLLTNLALTPIKTTKVSDHRHQCDEFEIFIAVLICLRWLDRGLFKQVRNINEYIDDRKKAQAIAGLMREKVKVITHQKTKDEVCRSIHCFLSHSNYATVYKQPPPFNNHYKSGVYRRLDEDVFSYVEFTYHRTD